MFVERREGSGLSVGYEGPSDETGVEVVDAAAILGDGCLHVFAVNRSVDDDIVLDVTLAGADLSGRVGPNVGARLLHHDDPAASNDWEHPNVVRAVDVDVETVPGGPEDVRLHLPRHSFVSATFAVS